MNIGRVYEPDSEHAQSLDHIRVLTLRSLKKLLETHNFEISGVKGSCAQLPKNMRLKKIVEVMDKFLTLFPSLSYRVVIIAKKLSM